VVVTGIADVRPRPRRVAIGNFDGVHRGHVEVIRGCDTVLTFDPHPLAVLVPDRKPPLLTTLRDRIARLSELGVGEVVVMPFDRRVAALSPGAFVEDILVGRLGAIHVSVGSDFRFGARAAGDLSTLGACPRFSTRGLELVRCRGTVVSSSRIRAAITSGDVALAAELLGRPHRVGSRLIGPRRVALDGAVLAPPPGSYQGRIRSPTGALPVELRVEPPTGDGVEASLVGRMAPPAGEDFMLEFLAPHR
jgi:riboflavin kinase/FMN adenylyltransferase